MYISTLVKLIFKFHSMKNSIYILIQAFLMQVISHAQIEFGESEFETIYDDKGVALPSIILHENASNYGFQIKPVINPLLNDPMQKVGDSKEYKVTKYETGILGEIVTSKNTLISNSDHDRSIRNENYFHQSGITQTEVLDYSLKSQINKLKEMFDVESLTSSIAGDIGGDNKIEMRWNMTNIDGFIEPFLEKELGSDSKGQFALIGSGYIVGKQAIDAQQNLTVRMPIKLDVSMNLKYSGQKVLNTKWGLKESYLFTIRVTMKMEISTFYIDLNNFGYPTASGDKIKVNGFSLELEGFLNSYVIEGIGSFLTNSILESSNNSVQMIMEYQNNTFSQDIQIYLNEKEQTLLTDFAFEYESKNTNDDQGSEIPSITAMRSWTWNGAFPWVYDSASDSWFYYYFTGNGYYAYNSSSRRWMSFDDSFGNWVWAR